MRGAGRESRLVRTRTRAAPGELEPLRTRTRLSRTATVAERSGCGHRPPEVAKARTRTRRPAAAGAAQTAETCGVQTRAEPTGAPYLHCLPRHDRDRSGLPDSHWPRGVAGDVTRPLDPAAQPVFAPIAAARLRPAVVRATRSMPEIVRCASCPRVPREAQRDMTTRTSLRSLPPRAPPRRSRRFEHGPRTNGSRTCLLPRRDMSRSRILLRDTHVSPGQTDTRSCAAPRRLSPRSSSRHAPARARRPRRHWDRRRPALATALPLVVPGETPAPCRTVQGGACFHPTPTLRGWCRMCGARSRPSAAARGN